MVAGNPVSGIRTGGTPESTIPVGSTTSKPHHSIGDFFRKITSVAGQSIDYFEENMWPVINEGRKISKNVFIVIKNTVPKSFDHMGSLINGTGLFSVVGFVFALKALPGCAKEFVAGIRLHDIEGVALSAIATVVNAFDALDSFMTFHGALSALGVIPQVAFFATIGLPVAVFLVGTGSVLGAYKATLNFVELYKMRKVTKIDNPDDMAEYLRKRIGATRQEKEAIESKLAAKGLQGEELAVEKAKQVKRLKMRKRKIVARHHGDSRIVNIMRNAKLGLKNGTVDLERAKEGMRDVKRVTAVNGGVNTVSAAVNATFLGMMVTSAATAMPWFAMPIAAIGKAGFSIAKFAFVKTCMDKFINDKELAKPFAKAAAAA